MELILRAVTAVDPSHQVRTILRKRHPSTFDKGFGDARRDVDHRRDILKKAREKTGAVIIGQHGGMLLREGKAFGCYVVLYNTRSSHSREPLPHVAFL